MPCFYMVSNIGSCLVGKFLADHAEIFWFCWVTDIIPIDILIKLAWVTKGLSWTRANIRRGPGKKNQQSFRNCRLFRLAYALWTYAAAHCSSMENSGHIGHKSRERCWDSALLLCGSSHVPFHCGQTCCKAHSGTFSAHQMIPLRTEANHLGPGTALEEKKEF